VPLGKIGTDHAAWIFGCVIGAAMFHFIGFAAYHDYCLDALYADKKRTILLDPTGKDPWIHMPTFAEMMSHRYVLFVIIIFCMAALAIRNYKYHFQGSKSIYLMKRLPDQRDLARRCLTLPVLGILASILFAAITTCLCYWVYMSSTPEVYLT
jgi:hypothetical protein